MAKRTTNQHKQSSSRRQSSRQKQEPVIRQWSALPWHHISRWIKSFPRIPKFVVAITGFAATVVTILTILTVLPPQHQENIWYSMGLIEASPTPTVTHLPTTVPVASATPIEGTPSRPDEVVIVVAQFMRTGALEYDTENDIIDVLDSIENLEHSARIIRVGHSIISSTEAERISELYKATVLIYGRVTPGGVTVNYLVTPRDGELRYEVDGELRIPRTEVSDFETFLYNGTDSSYIVGLTVGQLHYYASEYQEAIDALTYALNGLDEERIQTPELRADVAFVYLGLAKWELGQFNEAIEDYNSAIQVNPQSTIAYSVRGNAFLQIQETDHAISDLHRAIVTSHNDPYSLGYAYRDLGRIADAVDDLDATNEYYLLALTNFKLITNRHSCSNRGWLYRQLGQYEQALDEHRCVLEYDFFDAAAYHDLGITYSRLGEYEAALENYNQSIELDSSNPTAYRNRGQTWESLSHYDSAIEDYNSAIDLNPNYSLAYDDLGRVWVKTGDIDSALIAYNMAVQSEPQSPYWYRNRGLILIQANRVEEAIADFNTAIELAPHLAGLYQARANAYRQLGDYHAAVQDYSHALELNSIESPPSILGRGISYHRLQDYEKAITDYTAVIELDPDSAVAYNNRGMVHHELGAYGLALTDFAEAIRLDSANATYYNNRGYVYNSLGYNLMAVADYYYALRSDPEYALAYYNLGNALTDLTFYEAAVTAFQGALNNGYERPEHAYLGLGNVLAKQERLLEAVGSYNSAISLEPNLLSAYLNRAKAYHALGNLVSAAADLSYVIEVDPDNATAHYLRGNVNSDQHSYQEAVVDLTRSIELGYSPISSAYNNRGIANARQQNHDLAIADYTQAIEYDSYNYAAYNNRALELAAMGDITSALRDLDRAIEISPDYSLAFNNRGNIYADTGDKISALRDWNTAYLIWGRIVEYTDVAVPSIVTAELSETVQLHLQFSAREGAIFSASAIASPDASLDTILLLRSLDGTPLAYNDDKNASTRDSALLGIEIPIDGIYTLVVGSYHADSSGAAQIDIQVQYSDE